MRSLNRFFFATLFVAVAVLPAIAQKNWLLQTSLKYDALYFLSAVSHDEFYNRNYFRERATWQERLGPTTMCTIDTISDSIAGVRLTWTFTYIPANSLNELIDWLSDTTKFRNQVRKGMSACNDMRVEATNQDIDRIIRMRSQFITVFTKMRKLNWEDDWRLLQRKMLFDINMVDSIFQTHTPVQITSIAAAFLGLPQQPSDSSNVVYYLYYCCPNGFKLPYNMFGTWHIGYPQWFFSVHLHEYLHLYSIYQSEQQTIHESLLRQSPSFADDRKILVEKCNESDDEFYVAAADAYLSVKLGIRTEEEAEQYLTTQNGGSMRFSRILYNNLKESYRPGIGYRDFLTTNVFPKVIDGKLEPMMLQLK